MKDLFLEAGSEPKEAAEAAGHLGLATEKPCAWLLAYQALSTERKCQSSRTAVWKGLGLERARQG